MIEKFEKIKSLGVFADFVWDSEVEESKIFEHINILYGRNYSGKTTLSRLVRSLETGELSDKYENPEFNIIFKDEDPVNQTNYDSYTNNNGEIRVFNEDFVRDNLRFINNPDENIEPFALIGSDNVKIQEEIDQLEKEIGYCEEGQKTGLNAKLQIAEKDLTRIEEELKSTRDLLDKKLKDKATRGKDSIKYQSPIFGEQNYSIKILKEDIELVFNGQYEPLNPDKTSELKTTIKQDFQEIISKPPSLSLNLSDIALQTESLVTKKVGDSGKIEELVKDAELNRWAKEGRTYHKDKRDICAFCNNEIDEARWAALDRHFDEESERLESAIDNLIGKAKGELESLEAALEIDQNRFYSKFHKQIDELKSKFNEAMDLYKNSLATLIEKLEERKNDIINPKEFVQPDVSTENLEKLFLEYEGIRTESNKYANQLEADKKSAQKDLRLNEVYRFATVIDYEAQQRNIVRLETEHETAKDKHKQVKEFICKKKELVESKRRRMSDEEEGARKVNSYLNNFFGHNLLRLEARKNEDAGLDEKNTFFEVMRNGRKAYHLSEGECSFIAFCYFLAKLSDVGTQGSKPIIWIDDPVSSLDSSHIFLVYSLIHSEVVEAGKFQQLFISTHSLDFLKYLNSLKGNFDNSNNKRQSYERQFLMIERQSKSAQISIMPKYLEEYATEFNYLFHQIHSCSKINKVTDENHSIIYNFANNARKFFEIYLYYKYPCGTKDGGGTYRENMTKFFGNEAILTKLATKITNEYSHLGRVEQGAVPFDIYSETMIQTAKLIIERLKLDTEQYEAFRTSIEKAKTEEKETNREASLNKEKLRGEQSQQEKLFGN